MAEPVLAVRSWWGGEMAMSIHAPLKLWNHQARRIMKLWWASPSDQARRVNWDCLSSMVGKGFRRSVSVGTMLSGCFLCAAKLYQQG